MNSFRLASFVLCAFCLSSCATIINGTRQKIVVTSTPAGAVVTDGVNCWITPTEVILKRRDEHRLFIWKPGYNVACVQLKHSVSPVIIGNMLLPGGFLGVAIDLADGAEFNLVPERIDVTLQPFSKSVWFLKNNN